MRTDRAASVPDVDDLVITVDDPRGPEVRVLLERHLALMFEQSDPEDVHALDVDGLAETAVTFYAVRRAGDVLAVGALKRLTPEHVELKSMHTAAEARGQGVARTLLAHLLDAARAAGFRRISLETGTQDGFAPARTLYARAGFAPCGPFGDYAPSPASTFLTREL